MGVPGLFAFDVLGRLKRSRRGFWSEGWRGWVVVLTLVTGFFSAWM